MQKRGQVTQQFNWIFVTIAGGVILLLFLFVMGQLKDSGDAKLGVTILNNMDGILTGSESTDGAVSLIPIQNLFSLSVTCNDDSRLQISNSASSMDIQNRILYAPTTVGENYLFISTKELYRPFPLGNAVLLSDEDVLFVVYQPGGPDLQTEFLENIYEIFPDNLSKTTENLFKRSFAAYKHIAVVTTVEPPEFSRTSETYPGESVLKDKSVMWIQVPFPDIHTANVWTKDQRDDSFSGPETVTLPEDQFIVFLAHSSSAEFYNCNLDKLHKKLDVVNEIYKERTDSFYYSDLIDSRCKFKYSNAQNLLLYLSQSDTPYTDNALIADIQSANRGLLLASCPVLY